MVVYCVAARAIMLCELMQLGDIGGLCCLYHLPSLSVHTTKQTHPMDLSPL